MDKKLPVIYDYSNFRQYLSYYQIARQKYDPSFSKSTFSRMLGLPNTRSFFSDVVRGKKISTTFIERFIAVLNLTKEESQLFRVLVMFNQAENPAERELHLDQLVGMNKTSKKIIEKQILSFYANWYNSTIRAILDIYDFRDNYGDIAKKVYPRISSKQVEAAIKLLLKLRLIKKNRNGFYKPTDQSIATPDYIKNEIVKQYQVSCFEIAKQTIITNNTMPQSISTNVLSISDAAYKKIEMKLEQFRTEIRSLVQLDELPAKRVYQLDIALFPNSR